MASRISGITIEIGGDTTNLQKSLKGVDSQLAKTQKSLKDVNSLLKLDPTNTELLRQKQGLLRDAVSQTTEKLDKLKEAQAAMDASGVDKNSAEYRALQREIAATETDLKNATKAANNFYPSLEKVQAAAKKASEGLKSAAEKTRALSTAAAGMLTALAGMGVKALNTADDLLTMSQQTGLSTDELQKFAYASDRVDVSVEAITGALKKMKGNMTGQADAWKRIGVATTNADGSMRDATEVFYEALEGLAAIENETERDQVAMDLFGKSADELAGIIDDGGAALKAFGEEAEETGAIMDGETLESLGAMKDKFDEIKQQGIATLLQTGAKALQALTPIIEKVTLAIAKVLDWISSLSPETLKVIVIVLAAVAALSPLLSLVSGLAAAIGFLASPIGLIILAITALIAIGVLLYKNWDTIKQKAEQLKQKVATVWENIKTKINTVVATVNAKIESFKAKIETLKSKFESLKTKVTQVWESIKTKLQSAITLPHIPLPHFSVDPPGWKIGDLLKGTVPKLSISWYRKAYDNPMMFTSPTVMATPNGLKGFGDGHGAEIVLGLDKLRELVGSQNQNVNVTVVLEGDARNLFKVVKNTNTVRTRATSYNALAVGG